MTHSLPEISHTGSWISVLFGGLTGLAGIAVSFFGAILITEFVTDDTLAAIALFAIYSHPTLGLSIALLPTLWFTGRYAEKYLLANEKLLTVSFKYCLFTNLVLWGIFSIVFFFGPLASGAGLAIPLLFFFSFLILSTFTIGVMVCSLTRSRLTKKKNSAAT